MLRLFEIVRNASKFAAFGKKLDPSCIHSTTLLEKDVDLVPSPHPSNNTQKIENMEDTTGIAAVTNANGQELQGGQEAADGSQITASRKVVLDGACCLASQIK